MPARAPKKGEDEDAGKEKVSALYERLQRPSAGNVLEAYWPGVDDWLVAHFVQALSVGLIRVRWAKDGTESDMPSELVQKFGGDDAQERLSNAPPVGLRTLLRGARRDWTERDVAAAARKLKQVGVASAADLYRAIDADSCRCINEKLRALQHKTFAASTLECFRTAAARILPADVLSAQVAAAEELSNPPPWQALAMEGKSYIVGIAHPDFAGRKPLPMFDMPAPAAPKPAGQHDPSLARFEAADVAAARSPEAFDLDEPPALVPAAPVPKLREPLVFNIDDEAAPWWSTVGAAAAAGRAAAAAAEEEASVGRDAGESEDTADPALLAPTRGSTAANAATSTDDEAATVVKTVSLNAEATDAHKFETDLPSPQADEREESSPRRALCDRGHFLHCLPLPYDGSCDECGADVDKGNWAWHCGPCAFDLCAACHTKRMP